MPETIFNNPTDLAQAISAIRNGLVVFDGCSASGKTTLAKSIAKGLRLEVIHVDDFLDKNKGYFVDALYLDELRSAVSTALSKSGIAILEGVCARDILSRADLTSALFVYVARQSVVGVLSDLDILDHECPADGIDLMTPDGELDREIADYHQRMRPRCGADLIYIRQEVDGS